jgi:hypothetical protein
VRQLLLAAQLEVPQFTHQQQVLMGVEEPTQLVEMAAQ